MLTKLRGHLPVRFNRGSKPVSYDLVFCAHNEAESIEFKIANCRALAAKYSNLRIHVFNDGSSDATAEIASKYADHIRFVDSKDRMGKSVGMNQLLAGCEGEIT
ncbi:MAG: glycosyltransferase, partial [Pseudomonadota bacterium]